MTGSTDVTGEAHGLVSVIVPVYNTAEYLPRCLDSLADQTYPHLEILLIDDGSTDGSSVVCQEYAARDPRFRYLRQDNRGVSAARNAGLQLAGGRYVSLVDSDDWIEGGLYERVVNAFLEHQVDAVFFEYSVDYPNSLNRHQDSLSAYGVLDGRAALRLQFKSQNSFAATKVFRREIVADIRFSPNLYWGEECVFNFRVLQRASAICNIPDVLYHYVQSEGSATRQGFNPRRLSGIDTADELIRLCGESNPELLTLARAFKGGILADLLIEGAHEHPERLVGVWDLKGQLASVLLGTVTSGQVGLKQKIQWLLALGSVPALRGLRKLSEERHERARRAQSSQGSAVRDSC